jgi:hypothetical protein
VQGGLHICNSQVPAEEAPPEEHRYNGFATIHSSLIGGGYEQRNTFQLIQKDVSVHLNISAGDCPAGE